jgi:hypothetical protein
MEPASSDAQTSSHHHTRKTPEADGQLSRLPGSRVDSLADNSRDALGALELGYRLVAVGSYTGHGERLS